ncbi:vWA domain-containing protein [Pseudoalteromonas aurantia]|uniref:Ca-activated chloride channel protein n=1 Tax=Pseudoalteromonas aurantia 208 TaxID=1314867 RepID=A0ABR9E7D9_9GAMM|nr:VWA domain-containing protein [Pseudoalteromonas aurantia]MBE0366913.1 Ca-activated chloride channel protein [Pseudoalteromonas aurantia 208]
MNTNKTFIALTISMLLMVGCSHKKIKHEQEIDKASQQAQQERASDLEAVKKVMVAENALGGVQESSTEVEYMKLSRPVHKKALHSMRGRVAPQPPAIDHRPYFENRETYLPTDSNGVFQVVTTPLSTFSVDVDSGSYANIRSYLSMGKLPPKDAVREEAFINYFDYNYSVPEDVSQPFATYTEIAPAPWRDGRHIVRIGLQGYDLPMSERKPSNLVFLVDVSGSMHEENKLPLLVQSLTMMVQQLSARDTVSLVTYAGNVQVVLSPTKGKEQQTIVNALKALKAGGGTYGESGIKMAYQEAKKAFIKGGVNRVILATDGDFNVGITSIDALKELIAEQRKQGISLTTLGFGRGNYNDAMMEQLANIGNGNHAYIDTLHEAQKVLLRQMSGTLQSIANDVKIQLEFNPAQVKEYRLIGYQNRLLKDEDFNNDKVDAGEIGAGHTVTALYEVTLVGNKGQVDDLRYQQLQMANSNDELLQLKIRYKLPGDDKSQLISLVVDKNQVLPEFNSASSDFKFATSVAAFAQKLKHSQYLGSMGYHDIARIARANRGHDPFNYRGEFVNLVELASAL